jgi:NitT/TauT family transport system ATP-binding protein
VIVLSSAPSTIRDTVQVDLPAPRDQLTTKSDPRFAGLRARVLKGINTGLADGDEGADAAVAASAPNS